MIDKGIGLQADVKVIGGYSYKETLGALVGYFAIALKPLTVWDETVNNTVKRKIMRIGE